MAGKKKQKDNAAKFNEERQKLLAEKPITEKAKAVKRRPRKEDHPEDAPVKMGAPEFPYTDELGLEICEQVSISTCSMEDIILYNPHFPSEDVIRKWRLKRPDFGGMYARAKQIQAELFAEEAIIIADDGRNDWMEKFGDDGESIGWQLNGEHVQRSRLRIDTRKWIACKLAPRIYGDKQVLEVATIPHEEWLRNLK